MKRFYLKNTVMDWHPKNVMHVSHLYPFDGITHILQVDSLVPGNEDYE
jgi:hypothetical protein